MLDKLASTEERYESLTRQLADPGVVTDPQRLRTIGRELAALEPLVHAYRELKDVEQQLTEAQHLLLDAHTDDFAALVHEEVASLEAQREELIAALRDLLTPTHPLDAKDVIVEIRAGTGGEEAALWAADLYRIYVRYADSQNWRTQVLSSSPSDTSGFKEVIFEVKGRGAFSRLKYERGVHRVQRVPETEAQGRIHTSTATVAVLPEMDDIEVRIDDADLRVDVFRASGHGGQSVNTTDSAVRITHLPSGIVVTCQDERSQLQNRLRAMRVLRARLHELERERLTAERSESRRAQVGTGERAEKIRTYNFPQNRVTDHRIGLTLHRLDGILGGELDELVDSLRAAEQTEHVAIA
jgi:peptide chain release factor 1